MLGLRLGDRRWRGLSLGVRLVDWYRPTGYRVRERERESDAGLVGPEFIGPKKNKQTEKGN